MYNFLAVWKQLHVACMSVVKRYTRLDPLAMQISFVFLKGLERRQHCRLTIQELSYCGVEGRQHWISADRITELLCFLSEGVEGRQHWISAD